MCGGHKLVYCSDECDDTYSSHVGDLLSACGDGWLNLCALITQNRTDVQPQSPRAQSVRLGSGEAASTNQPLNLYRVNMHKHNTHSESHM